MNSREERLVKNELLFRQVNERIAELGEPWGSELEIVCECADDECTRVINVRADEYARIRQHPNRFIVLGGHEIANIENVVETNGSYIVVDKLSELLREVAGPT